jgi:hypothetical protein
MRTLQWRMTMEHGGSIHHAFGAQPDQIDNPVATRY